MRLKEFQNCPSGITLDMLPNASTSNCHVVAIMLLESFHLLLVSFGDCGMESEIFSNMVLTKSCGLLII